MAEAPDRYAVVGHPVSHSRSPEIHARFARQTGQAMEYGAMDLAPDEFEAGVRVFFAAGGRGLNVTLPHKEAAARLADALTPRAERAGAVNTLAAQPDGTVLGDNTDGAGLMRDLQVNLDVRVEGSRVLLVGAGGAARGVVAPLLAAAPGVLVLTNRTMERAEVLAADFQDIGPVVACPFEGLLDDFDLVINATSASLAGQRPALPDTAMSRATVAYDMMYGSKPSAFMDWAAERGARQVSDGLGMLVEQAAESFLLWRGVRPDTAPVLAALRESDA